MYMQVVDEVSSGGICGEIGVLCYRPQLFTVRTKRLCQLLRLNRTVLLNLVQANVGDGAIIMNNLLEVCMSTPFALISNVDSTMHNKDTTKLLVVEIIIPFNFLMLVL